MNSATLILTTQKTHGAYRNCLPTEFYTSGYPAFEDLYSIDGIWHKLFERARVVISSGKLSHQLGGTKCSTCIYIFLEKVSFQHSSSWHSDGLMQESSRMPSMRYAVAGYLTSVHAPAMFYMAHIEDAFRIGCVGAPQHLPWCASYSELRLEVITHGKQVFDLEVN